MRKLWSTLREQTDDQEEKQTEDNMRVRGVETQSKICSFRNFMRTYCFWN